jgi:hypothetical protein
MLGGLLVRDQPTAVIGYRISVSECRRLNVNGRF